MIKGLEKFRGRPRATTSEIRALEQKFERLPADYRAFLLTMSGGSGDVGPAYLELWGAAELVENNAGYSYFKESAPGLVLIGSDGGGEGFGFDTRAQPAPIVMIPFVSSGWLDALEVASGFGKFLERLAAGYDIFGSPSVPVSRTAKKG